MANHNRRLHHLLVDLHHQQSQKILHPGSEGHQYRYRGAQRIHQFGQVIHLYVHSHSQLDKLISRFVRTVHLYRLIGAQINHWLVQEVNLEVDFRPDSIQLILHLALKSHLKIHSILHWVLFQLHLNLMSLHLVC